MLPVIETRNLRNRRARMAAKLACAAVVAAGAVALGSAYAGTLTLTPLVMGGDPYYELAIVNSLSASDNLAVNNSGQWVVEAVATNSVSLLIRGTGTELPGTVFMAEGQDVPAPAPKGALFISFDDMRLNNSGNLSSNLFFSPPTNTDAVYFNADRIITEGDISTATGFSPNTVWVAWFGAYINDLDQILLLGTVDDPAITGTADRAIVRLDDPAGAATQTVLVKNGDEFVPGRFIAGIGTSTHNHAFANGHAMVVLDLDGDTANDGLVAMHNGTAWTILAREGDPSPVVPGRNWGAIGTATGVDVNNNGDWVMRSTLNAPLADDTHILKNGRELIAREGGPVAAFDGAFTFGAFVNTAVHIDNDGNVYYYATWNGPSAVNAGFFRNHELIVQKGVATTQAGELLTAISGGQSNMAVSDNGRYMLFEGTLTHPETSATRQGTILVELIGAVPGDLNDDGIVNVDDLLILLAAWGPCPPKQPCSADIAPQPDGDDLVNVDDLLLLLANWG